MTGGSPRLRKELGLFDVYAISTGAMFSSGFFLLPGLAAAQTGPSVALAYLVAGLFILPAMFSVAELSTAMPRAGGAYYFLDRSLGPLVGTVGGLGTWLALVLKSAFALVGMGAYLRIYFPGIPIEPLALGLTVVFVLVNIVGAKETSGLQRVLVTALVAIMAFFIVQGLAALGSGGAADIGDRFSPFLAFGFQGFIATVGFVFVSYAGLTKVASVAEEIRNPDRNIPLGMVLSLLTAAVVYSIGVAIIVAVLPPDELRHDLTPVATAARAFFGWLPGGAGVALIVAAAIAAFASTGNAGLLSASRYPLAMARDHLVSERFGRLGRFRTPTFAIVVTGLLMAACILFLDVEGIAKLASAFQLVLFSLLCLAVIIMRESRIAGYDPGFRSPFYPWMQIAGFVTPFWLIAEMGELAVVFTLGLVALTICWYFAYGRQRATRAGAIFHTFARLGERQHAGLDAELRGIVKEKGLRAEDPFDEIVARAAVLELPAGASFDGVLREAAGQLARGSGLAAGALLAGFEDELRAGFMPVAHGAAIPHLRVAGGLQHPRMLLVRSREGVRIEIGPEEAGEGARKSELVYAIFFLLSPEDEPGQHLRLLGHLATHVDDEGFVERWLAAGDADELRATLLREERSLMVRLADPGPLADWAGRRVRDLQLPRDLLIALVRRDGHGIIPGGDLELRAGDRLTVIGTPEAVRDFAERCGLSRSDPEG
ncbi:MAG: amino acid permease [Gemmatimonadales bacterium]|jgi:amino acid transporter/mannitol/fructose-specific phosphotransferase system IIA component (Ntr-type)